MTDSSLTLSEIPSGFQELLKTAHETWAPGSRLEVVKSLGGGRSGAHVLLIDISYPHSGEPRRQNEQPLASGEYVLKLDEQRTWDRPEIPEAKRHERAVVWNQSFAAEHIPPLVQSLEQAKQSALLYDVAGFSLVSMVTADSLDASALAWTCRQLSTSLLNDLNSGYSVAAGHPPSILTERWLGYRLDPAKTPRLQETIKAETHGANLFVAAGRVFVNPFWLVGSDVLTLGSRRASFNGLLHGDLHPGNILINKYQANAANAFWLIDFALSFSGPLFYDHAYLELALLVQNLVTTNTDRLFGVLRALEVDRDRGGGAAVPVPDVGLVSCIQSLRAPTLEWQRETEPKHGDAFDAQMELARVAAGLNWANKNLDPEGRRLAFLYAAWAATAYVSRFHVEEWRHLQEQAETRAASVGQQSMEGSTSAEREDLVPKRDAAVEEYADHAWADTWQRFWRFDGTAAKFVLVSDVHASNEDLASLGFLPWSLVLDLDPWSDERGLRKHVAPILSVLRSSIQFGRQPVAADFERGTAWVMCAGWPSRDEPIPGSQRDWRRLYLPEIRNVLHSLHTTTDPQPVKVLVLSSGGGPQGSVESILEAIDETFGDSAETILVSAIDGLDTSLVAIHHNTPPAALIERVRATFGTSIESSDYQLPGIDGPVSIPTDRLRHLEEDLDVLHSGILRTSVLEGRAQDEFWRGNPPSWADLHAGIDIKRDIHSRIVGEIQQLLAERRNQTVELQHLPGAGGTTAALRAAWTLRETYPTVVLRRHSHLTVDRVDQLFQLTQLPVLLVADGSLLLEPAREELYRGLAARNARVVILYVVRAYKSPDEHTLHMPVPMDPGEAKRFNQQYRLQTDNPDRIKTLDRITTSDEPKWVSQRTPFFYGLVVYERDFASIDRYVSAHLEHIAYRPRRILQYLALVTRFSQVSLDEGILQRLLGLPSGSPFDVEETVGTAAARLVLRQGRRLRLIHPLVAEEVLRQLVGGGDADAWRDGVADLSIDFIQSVNRLLGCDTEEERHLFLKLFIRRVDWSKETSGRPNFAEIISTIRSKPDQQRVLQTLTDECPDEAHYWNHLGRHLIYESKDFDLAEQYLNRAVGLAPEDPYHYHTLGMVRRFRITDSMDRLFSDAEGLPTAEQILDSVGELVDAAAHCFSLTRELSPEDSHGYVTHIQMILSVTERLARASGSQTITATETVGPRVQSWLEKNLVVAEDLLERVQHMRAESRPTRFEINCVSRLQTLYGNFEALIESWRRLLKADESNGDLRRALSTAHYARGGRMWSKVAAPELREVVELMKANLAEDPANERDLRMWFNAYRRLPEFSYLEALGRLEAWAAREDSLDAHYYSYILYYLQWRQGLNQNEAAILEHLDQCHQLFIGRRGQSYEWLGKEPAWCPIVHHKDLGQFDRKSRFFPRTDLLEVVTGTIESIKGRQAGTVRLGPRFRAFFVPPPHVWESADVNATVHFYLGFSYEGFRAWSVELGPGPKPASMTGKTSLISPDHLVVMPPDARSDPMGGKAVAHEIAGESESLRERVLQAIRELLVEADGQSKPVLLSALGIQLTRRFPGELVYRRLGFNRLTALLQSYDELVFAGAGERTTVNLRRLP